MMITAILGPIDRLPYLNAAPRRGTSSEALLLRAALANTLPDGVDALLVTSDLQGVVPDWSDGGAPTLLGVQLARRYGELADEGVVPRPARTGVLLLGDLYSAPGADVRGASGDVRSVWEAFAASYAWVAGVAGNHDRFGPAGLDGVAHLDDTHLLDGDIVTLGGARFGGVSWIMGNGDKAGRRDDVVYLDMVERVASQQPDVLLLHQPPRGGNGQRGDTRLSELLTDHPVPLTICGHAHWDHPLYTGPGGQILNVDKRALVVRVS